MVLLHTNPGAKVVKGPRINFVAKTGDYTVTQGESGTHFSNTGAGGAVNFTLPPLKAGLEYWFHAAVLAQNLTVTAPGVDTMVVFNDIAADSIAFSTTNEKAGGGFYVTCDGTLWYVLEFTHHATAGGNQATIAT